MKIFYWDDIISAYSFFSQTETAKNETNETLNSTFFNKKTALTIGKFDGAHLGHQALFNKVIDYAKKNNILSGVVIIYKSNQKSILPINLRIELLQKMGFDFCIVIDFSNNFSKILGRDFLDILRNVCSMQFLATGSDFRFGHNLDTGVAELSDYCNQYDLELDVCQNVCFKGNRISSTITKEAILQGDIEQVRYLLGDSYYIDASDFVWQTSSSETSLILIANITDKQILPPSKAYDAQLVCNDTEAFVVQCTLYVESNFLRLEIPLEQISSSINLINITQFILGIKIKGVSNGTYKRKNNFSS